MTISCIELTAPSHLKDPLLTARLKGRGMPQLLFSSVLSDTAVARQSSNELEDHVRAQQLMPSATSLLQRYQELCDYVGLTPADFLLAQAAWLGIEPHVDEHVADFYDEILKHEEAAAVFTGGVAQVERLKASLRKWIVELFHGPFDATFVQNRWIVGWRHVKIGLPQIWTATAMCRLRDRMLRRLAADWIGTTAGFENTASAITRLMDLDLALIQDAYYAESVARRLRHERDFAEAIIGTTQAIVLLVAPDGKILRGNSYVAQLVGGDSELPRQIESISELLLSDQSSIIETLIADADMNESAGPAVTVLIDAQSRSRTIRWFCRTLSHLGDVISNSHRHAHLLVGHDITDLTEAQRAVVRQERLAAIGQTMTGLAHESRNAFQRSQASLETLALEVSDKPDAVELIGRIQRAHDHLLHLYEEVLQFAKPIRLDLARNRIHDIVVRTWTHIVQASGHPPERLNVQSAVPLPDVLCDAFALEQILRNLIENALAVSPPDETVDVSVASEWQGNQPAVRIMIRDKGAGVPEKYKESVFDPFFSTRPRGTGLGLPIARRLAEAHGGTLELTSEPTGGATAILILPVESSGDSALDLDNQPDYRRT